MVKAREGLVQLPDHEEEGQHGDLKDPQLHADHGYQHTLHNLLGKKLRGVNKRLFCTL